VKKGGQVINPEHLQTDSQVEEFFFFFSSLSRFGIDTESSRDEEGTLGAFH
jgi:hypothetical protein